MSGILKALFVNMGKVIPYFKMTPEVADQLHSSLAKVMMYAKSEGLTLTKKQKEYILDQTKQLDMYEKSLTPQTPKGPKAEVIDLSKKLPEDAPYSEKNPTGWMPTEKESRGILSNVDYNEDLVSSAIENLKGKADTKSFQDEIKKIIGRKGTYSDYSDAEIKGILDGIEADTKKQIKSAEEIIDEGDFDPSGFKDGGRIGYAVGRGLKLLGLLKKEGTTLKKQMKETMNDFFQRSGDAKYDADALTDSFFEKLGIDIDSVDIKDKLDVYDKFYKELTKQSAKKALTPKEAFLKQYFAKKKREKDMYEQAAEREIDAMEAAADVGMKEPMGLTAEDIYAKYQGKISDDLLKNIVKDNDPQRQAEVMGTLDEVLTMMDKGMDKDQIMNVLKNMKRTKNASGGLNYLMGL
jgi:hypothetical protein